MRRRVRILHLTAELWPYAQTGGLGQAVAGLAAYQAHSGLDTSVLMPLYREARSRAGPLEPLCDPFTVQVADRTSELRCWRQIDRRQSDRGDGAPGGGEGPQILFLEHDASFDRAAIYGPPDGDYPDNHHRFALFGLGALEVARRLGLDGLILHAHDWHAALAPVFARETAARPDQRELPCVVTVHNGGFQGVFPQATLREIGLPDRLWSPDFMEWYGRLNYLKGGVASADLVTTVSPTHAIELQSDVGGFGLQDLFRRLGDRLVGIRNGIDTEKWDPSIDRDIPAHFHQGDLTGKDHCKHALQAEWQLPQDPHIPLFAMSARLVAQKGIDLVLGSQRVRGAHAQFIFLGAGEPRYETALAEVARAYPDRVRLNTAFTDHREHRLLAGADFLLMPSLYEPCGLTQMRAQRYAALPLARRVGGLADTIDDGRTGILFDAYTAEAFDHAVDRALELYRDHGTFRRLARGAMSQDFSWSQPAEVYSEVYRRAYAARAGKRRRSSGGTPSPTATRGGRQAEHPAATLGAL
jgi:starch synthase